MHVDGHVGVRVRCAAVNSTNNEGLAYGEQAAVLPKCRKANSYLKLGNYCENVLALACIGPRHPQANTCGSLRHLSQPLAAPWSTSAALFQTCAENLKLFFMRLLFCNFPSLLVGVGGHPRPAAPLFWMVPPPARLSRREACFFLACWGSMLVQFCLCHCSLD